MKTRIEVRANASGMYQVPIADYTFEGDVFDFNSMIVRAELDGEKAMIFADALQRSPATFVNLEVRVDRFKDAG